MLFEGFKLIFSLTLIYCFFPRTFLEDARRNTELSPNTSRRVWIDASVQIRKISPSLKKNVHDVWKHRCQRLSDRVFHYIITHWPAGISSENMVCFPIVFGNSVFNDVSVVHMCLSIHRPRRSKWISLKKQTRWRTVFKVKLIFSQSKKPFGIFSILINNLTVIFHDFFFPKEKKRQKKGDFVDFYSSDRVCF